MKSKISYAVAAILGSVCVAAPAAEPAATTGESGAEALGEVLVTAQRRAENIQNVPISMTALTSQTLQQLNVSTLDDYIRFLPSVTTANNGPGQSEIFIRGISAGSQPSQGSASTGLWPNVAIYLDNQSGQLPNRNLDIYAADLNRIEVLEGPQGTLFGAGAQAGAIRYITNEPRLDATEANVTASYGTTAHGDNNSAVTAVLNVPVLEHSVAARVVIYNDTRGGYINNVPATFTRSNSDAGIHYANYSANAAGQCPNGQPPSGPPFNGYCVPPGSPAINNFNIAANHINGVTYKGIRGSLLWQINDDWSALIAQTYQHMDSQGVFYQQPNASDGAPLQPLEVTLFNPASNRDRFSNTSWTVNGKFGALHAVYTGGYLVRNVDQIGDYTNYARGVYADYYQCYGPGSGYVATLPSRCFSPSASWHSAERNVHQQHEFRLSTPDDWRIRGILGAFWEKNVLYDQTGWLYKTVPSCTPENPPTDTTGCFANIGTIPGTTVQNPGILNDNTSFYQDTIRQTKQTAVFGSFDFDLIPKTLTLTAGTRWFKFENLSAGSVSASFGCFNVFPVPPSGCAVVPTYSFNLNAQNLSDSESGFKSRVNLTWHVTPDVMLYYTFSQGFRPGGFNQNGGSAHAFTPATAGPVEAQFLVPRSYTSDKLTNNELGWKTELFEHRLQWNGAVYYDNWDNVQVAFFDPGAVGNVFFNVNGQDFLVKGLETSLIARPLTGLTLQGEAAWNQSSQTNSPVLTNNNPASANYGQPITNACRLPSGTVCSPVVNPYGPIGSPAANAPPVMFRARARYEWTLNGGYVPFVQFGWTHNGHSFTQAGANPTIAQTGGAVTTGRLRFENPAYSVFDASVGVSKDPWFVQLYAENLGNNNASTFVSTDQFIVAQTPLRPRVIGGTFGWRF
ncbi:MAG TPA: TonB-dependent receptor [Steroidobacteraceae bacterium]|nr:TonB-dependent receptor [Steroidobacteraceae bacterium]